MPTTNVPAPGFDEALRFQFAVRLENGVGVEGRCRHHLARGGETVAPLQQAQTQALLDLVDDLEIAGDSAPPTGPTGAAQGRRS